MSNLAQTKAKEFVRGLILQIAAMGRDELLDHDLESAFEAGYIAGFADATRKESPNDGEADSIHQSN